MATLSVAELCDLLVAENFAEDVVVLFRKNRIDGGIFRELDDSEFLDLGIDTRLIGDRKKLKIRECLNSVQSEVSIVYVISTATISAT